MLRVLNRDDKMLLYFPSLKNQCYLDESDDNTLILYFPGCNDRCIGVDYLIWNLERFSNADIICIEYGYKLER